MGEPSLANYLPGSLLQSGGGRKRHPLPYFPHQPEKALEVYDEAYRKNPHDASLVSRIGQAYVKTHQYAKVRLPWGRSSHAGKERKPMCQGSRWEGTECFHSSLLLRCDQW